MPRLQQAGGPREASRATVTGAHAVTGPVRFVPLPKLADERGSLTVLEGQADVCFDIARLFYLYDVPGGAARGGHAHRRLEQFFVALSGSVRIVTDDGATRKRYLLDDPCLGLYVGPMIWVEVKDFSPGSVCLVLASLPYDESDYYRDYGEYAHQVRDLP